MNISPGLNALFQKTKGQLFYKKGAGFLGRILGQVSFEWTDHPEIDTAAISVNTLYWKPEFFESLDPESRVTVLAHELWHNALLHTVRLGNRCPEIWNLAADHVINLMLKEHGYYMGGFPYVMDDKFKSMSTEEVYDILISEGGKPMSNPMGKDVIQGKGDQVHEAVGKVVAATTSARISGEAGIIPGELVLVLDHFLNPKLPWETLLFNYFNALTSDEYSFTRPNRRYHDPIIPGVTGRNGLEHLIFYTDISGSVTDHQILRMNSEVKFIQEELKPERLTLVTFDTKIRDIFEFEYEEDFEKIKVVGRGGTSLKGVFKHALEHMPSAIVVFSDMYVEIPSNPGMPVIWVCVDNPSFKAPYGNLVHLTD